MNIALAQTNPVVGDIIGNTQRVIDLIHQARQQGASLVVFPELTVMGYPPRDLLLKPRFIQSNLDAVQRIAAACTGVAALIGFVDFNRHSVGRTLRNAAAYCADGQVRQVRYKSLLPTYDVFDERRYFEPGDEIAVIEHEGVPLGVSICEDLWNEQDDTGRRMYPLDPIGKLAASGARVLINMSASPFGEGKGAYRSKIFGAQAARHGLPIVFVNQAGGNDEILFDGASCVFDARGRVVARLKQFEEDLKVIDPLADNPVAVDPAPEDIAQLHDALVMGIRDYVRKCGFKAVVLGLSGGIDSALVASLAAAAVGPENVHGVALPSRYSSDHSLSDAEALARNLGLHYRVIPIGPIHAAFEENIRPHFDGRPPDVTEENLQARIRGNILMALSNKFGWLLLTTGNKSELAMGYCTLYGDMAGGLAVISDVFKTRVYELARHVNARAGREVIPAGSLTKAPSAELRPNQTDQDSLPPYDLLDAILDRYINQEQSTDEIIAAGFDPDLTVRVIRAVDANEYKRKQAPPGLKVSGRAFGFGRRMPIAARYRY